MKVSKALTALRGNVAPQRRALAESAEAIRRARQLFAETDEAQALRADLEAYAGGADLAICPTLSELMTNADAALLFWAQLSSPLHAALKEHPFGEAPFSFHASHGHSQIQALRCGRATLTLAAYEPLDTVSEPESVLLSDRETVEIVLRGSAHGTVHRREDDAALYTAPVIWKQGNVIRTRPLQSARQIVRVESSLLLLQLTREAERPRPACEVAVKTGAVLRSASGDKSASQALMALGVLGALRSYSALDVMHRTALNRAEDADVRWEAVRQTLGLEPKRGFEFLGALIDAPEDPLSAPAKALREQLLATQPELRALIGEAA